MQWQPKEIQAFRNLLPYVRTYREAATFLSKQLGRRITMAALHCLSQREGLTGVNSTLGTLVRNTVPLPLPPEWDDADEEPTNPHIRLPSEPPPPDPMKEHEERKERTGDKRTIKTLLEQLHEARARQGFLDRIAGQHQTPRILPRERTSGIREMVPVVLASDWHVEEGVDPEAVAYRNEYNLEIAAHRIERFFQSIIWNVEHHRGSGRIAIRDLVLWIGGDIMTGYIHEELMEGNALSPTETILWVLPKIRDGILTLLERLDLEHIEIPCSYGNHGRTTFKPRVATGYSNSFEWLMYHSLASQFDKEPRVHFEITPSGHQYVEVLGQTIHFHHGDDVKYMGGIGGLGIPLLKAVPSWDLVRRADVHCIGHHHSLRDFGRAIVNGSLIGYGPYSQRIRAEFEVPQQAMFYMDQQRGKSMLTALWVAEVEGATRVSGRPPAA